MISPKHVAIIMDGNGRWGLKNKKSRNLGHKTGLKTVEKIIKSSIKNKIKYLTLYAFSTENWKRPKLEIKFLLSLLEFFLNEKIEDFYKSGIKLKIIGDLKKFPKKIILSQIYDNQIFFLKLYKLLAHVCLYCYL